MKIIELVAAHITGEYIIQRNIAAYMEATCIQKESSFLGLLIQTIAYCIPFNILFGMDYRLAAIAVTHIIVNTLKTRYKKICHLEYIFWNCFFLSVYLV